MHPNDVAVVLKRAAELIETKMATGKALSQVADEVVAFNEYCRKNKKNPGNITTDNLRTCKLK